MNLDVTNAAFEFVGAGLAWQNVATLYRAKSVVGVFWPLYLFYSAWGLFGGYFYLALGQWWSLVGQILLVSANISWTVLAVRYSRSNK